VTIEKVVEMGTSAWRMQWIIGAIVLFDLRGAEWKRRSGCEERESHDKDESVGRKDNDNLFTRRQENRRTYKAT